MQAWATVTCPGYGFGDSECVSTGGLWIDEIADLSGID